MARIPTGDRDKIGRLLGGEVEAYVGKFAAFSLEIPSRSIGARYTGSAGAIGAHVLVIRLADYLEHLLDLEILYYVPQ